MAHTAMDDHPLLSAAVEVPDDLAARAAERGWDDGLLARALELRVPRADIEFWLTAPHIAPEEVAYNLETLSRTFCGPLRTREATWRDGEALADLYANAPEDVGEWRLTVERGPNPYAQFRLQEHANIQVVECKGVLLAATAHSGRNTIIAGERTSAHFMSAWRVRGDFRGMGLSRILQMTAGPASAWFGMITYWYERSDNASQGWLDKMSAMAESRGNAVGALTSTVHMFEPSGGAGGAPTANGDAGLRIRPVEPADLGRCVELINRTHGGLDLFRPYTAEFLEMHLDDPFWGPKPPFWAKVFSWDDYAVVEDDGEIVACGGLWDKGCDVREVWEHRETGERRVLEPTALIDWGHAPGREDAIAALIRHFLTETAGLGRTHLLAPLDHAPAVAALLDDLPYRTETRALKCMGFASPEITVEAQISRPYTDLAYW
jgi:hypothetical protein